MRGKEGGFVVILPCTIPRARSAHTLCKPIFLQARNQYATNETRKTPVFGNVLVKQALSPAARSAPAQQQQPRRSLPASQPSEVEVKDGWAFVGM